MTPESHEPERATGRRLYTALACYGAIALLAGYTLDGNFRKFVWTFLGALVLLTYFHARRKP